MIDLPCFMKEDKRTYELLSTCIVGITSNRWMRVQHNRDIIFIHTETLYHPSLSPIPKPMWLRSNTIRYKFVFVRRFFAPLETFSLIWRRHRATNFYVYSALVAIEQWGFFNVPHLLWHGHLLWDGQTLYNDHLRASVTLVPVAERLALEVSLLV